MGLEKGGDDYLAKPFIPKELVIRTKRILDRAYNNSIIHIQRCDGYKIDYDKRIVYDSKNKLIELTFKEFELLSYLAKNLPQALSREQILKNVWGDDYFGTDRVVDEVIRRLRKKMPELKIETIYGYGYRMIK